MTTYKYKGLSKGGANVEGIIRAENEYEAAAKVRENCAVITKMDALPDDEAPNGKYRIKTKELALLCSKFSIILASGIPVVKCVEMVGEQCRNKVLAAELAKVAEDVQGGVPLAQAFDANVPGLPKTFIQTVRCGEQSGTMESCFKRLQEYYDKQGKMGAKVAGALAYPAIVILVGIVVIALIMIFAVPTFTSTFESLGTELPGITKALVATSNFFRNFWWLLLILGGFAYVLFQVAKRDAEGKRFLADFSLRHSPLRTINSMNAAAQFATTLSTLVGAGLPLVQALEVSGEVVDNYVFSEAVRKVKEDVEQGKTMRESMLASPYFPQLLSEMVGVGEESGSMQQTLDVIGDYFSNETTIATDRLLALMEPAITIVLAVVVSFLLLSVYLPMFSMYGSI